MPETVAEPLEVWKVYIDRASNPEGGGADIVLILLEGKELYYAL